MGPLVIANTVTDLFAQLVLGAGATVLALLGVVSWTRRVTRDDQDSPND